MNITNDIINMNDEFIREIVFNLSEESKDSILNEIFDKLKSHSNIRKSTLQVFQEKCYNRKITPSELGRLKFLIRMNGPYKGGDLYNDDGGFVDYMLWKNGIIVSKKDTRLRQDDVEI